MGNKTEFLASKYIDAINPFIEDNRSFYKFRDDINQSGPRFVISERYVDRNVDITWLDKIEDSVIALDNILRNPRNFIQDIEEIVPIEMSKKISSDSVKHLATHTNLIQDVDKEDNVTPRKILNIYKEESFATYENRFIKTLLTNLEIFVEKRYLGLMSQKDVNNINSASTEQTFKVGKETISYVMEIKVSRPSITDTASHQKTDDSFAQQNINDIERVTKIRKIIHDFMSGDFMLKMKDAPLVHPPISKTNLLTKNQDYKKALELWQFIESYTAQGYNANLIDNSSMPQMEYQERMNEISYIEYLLLKKYSGTEADQDLTDEITDSMMKMAEANGKGSGRSGNDEETAKMLRRQFRQILGNYDDHLEEIKRIFVEELQKRNHAIEMQEKRIKEAIIRIIAAQKALELKELMKKRKAEDKEARKKALLAKKKEKEELAKKAAKERKAKEKLKKQKALSLLHQKKIEEALRIKAAIALKQQHAREERLAKEIKLKDTKIKKEKKVINNLEKIEKKINIDSKASKESKLERAKRVISEIVQKTKERQTEELKQDLEIDASLNNEIKELNQNSQEATTDQESPKVVQEDNKESK